MVEHEMKVERKTKFGMREVTEVLPIGKKFVVRRQYIRLGIFGVTKQTTFLDKNSFAEDDDYITWKNGHAASMRYCTFDTAAEAEKTMDKALLLEAAWRLML